MVVGYPEFALADFATTFGFQPLRASRRVFIGYHCAYIMPERSALGGGGGSGSAKSGGGRNGQTRLSQYEPSLKALKEGVMGVGGKGTSAPVAFSVDHVAGAGIVLTAGLFIALVTFVMEFVSLWWMPPRKSGSKDSPQEVLEFRPYINKIDF